MNTRSVQKFVNSFTVSLAGVCAVYVALVLGSTLALNHEQALHLNDWKIGRIWLPANYAPDDGYEVPVAVIVRDLNTEMLFGLGGARALDVLTAMALFCAFLQLTTRLAERRGRLQAAARRETAYSLGARVEAARPLRSARPAERIAMHPPLGKAAPYGDTRRHGPANVLSFPKH